MNTPILLLLFNRPDFVERLINQLSLVKPRNLYIAIDGPRNTDDAEKIKEIIMRLKQLEWESEIKYLIRDNNLKTFKAIPSAIDWFFQHEELGIILEDDCLPDKSFFVFCEELLSKYKNNESILSISGNNLQSISYGDGSYFLSKIPHIWGWATWKRAWDKFDCDMKHFPQYRDSNRISESIKNHRSQKRFMQLFNRAFKGQNIWDYKWTFAHFNYNGYSIIPNKNLVTNIGFDLRATNLQPNDSFLANLPLENINKVMHPSNLEIPIDYSDFLELKVFQPHNFKSYLSKLILYLRKWKVMYS